MNSFRRLGLTLALLCLCAVRVSAQCRSAISPATLPGSALGASYKTAVSFTPTTKAPYDWSVAAGALPTGLGLTQDGSDVAVIEGTTKASGNFSFTLKVSAADGCVVSQDFTITVGASCSISPSSLPDGTFKTPYTATLTNSSTAAPYDWNVSAGAPPTGVVLKADGSAKAILTGTPIETGVFNFSIKTGDAKGCVTSSDYSIRICGLVMDPPTIADATATVPYNATFAVSGGKGPYRWTQTGLSADFKLSFDPTTGDKASIDGTPGKTGVVTFTLTATDSSNGCSVSTTYTIKIGCPTMSISPVSVADGTARSAYNAALTVSGSTGPYTWRTSTGLPPGVTLTSDTSSRATLSGTPTTAGSYAFTITVTDGLGCSTARDYRIAVAPFCPTQTITPTALADGSVKVAYSASLSVTATAKPYTWAVSAGALPDGLKLTTDTTERALIEGTPTREGNFAFTLKVSDGNGCTTAADYKMVIGAGCPTLSITPTTLSTGTVKTAYGESLVVTGSAAPYSWSISAGALPTGLRFTSDTGSKAVIDGTPTTEGSYSFTVKVADAAGCSTSVAYTVRVVAASCPTLSLTPSTLPSTQVKDLYGQSLLVSGSSGPFTWGVSTGDLPPGLRLTSDTGAKAVIEGNATTAGSYSFTIKVGDAAGCSVSVAYAIRVTDAGCPALAINPASLGDGSVKVAYSATLGVTTSKGPYAWSVSTGALPPGLKLSSDITERAIIEGIPTTEGSYPFTISVKDGAGCATSLAYTIRIAPAGCPTLTIGPSVLSSGSVNSAYAAKVAVTATKAPYTWSVSAGALPPGLGLSSDGTETLVIKGTPTREGFYTFTLKVADGAGCTGSIDYTLTISGGCTINTVPTTLQAPRDRSTVTSPIVFQWLKVDGAIKYQLFVGQSGRFDLFGETDGTTLERIVSPGQYDWYVVTNFASCPSQQSAPFHFTIPETTKCGDGSVTIATPRSGETVTSPAALSWSALAGTTVYRVWIAVDGGAASALAKTTDTSIKLALPAGRIEWYVEAVPSTSTCPSIFSPRSTFTVTPAVSCDGNVAATIVAPAASAELTSPVDLQWRGNDKARGYRIWVALAGQPFEDVGFVNDIHYVRALKPGKYEWYIDTYYESCPTVSSQHSIFSVKETAPRCVTTTPALLQPANGGTAKTSPVVFSWTPVPTAIGYRLFVSTNGSPFLFVRDTSDTSYNTPVPPGAIVWYVEAVFDGCTSTDSDKSTFTVPRAVTCDPTAQVKLVSPPDGATNVPSIVTFDWDAVQGATQYIVYARSGDGAFTQIGSTTDTSLQKYVPPGTVDWYVDALRDGCDPVTSARARFTVANPDACTNRRPVILAPSEGAGNLLSPVTLSWTPVQNATKYTVFADFNGSGLAPIATTQAAKTDVALPDGNIRWFVEASFDGCPPTISADATFSVVKPAPTCATPNAPTISVPAQVVADSAFTVRWGSVTNARVFELQEARKSDFSDATTQVVEGLEFSFTHTASNQPVQYLYRVRGISNCSDDRGPYSNVIGIFIIPPAAKSNASAEVGTPTNVVQTIFLPGSQTPVRFTARSDQSWVHITPSSGVVPPEGLTLTITADPTVLAPGTNTGTIIIDYEESGKNGIALGNRTTSSSVSVSLVSPVQSKGKNTPVPESLIIPAVAHTAGANGSMFESDIRLANTSSQPQKYQVFFTPSGANGTVTSSSTQIQVGPGETMALDDVLASFFGSGNNGGGATGMMEIRPVTTASTTSASTSSGRGRTTVASSRTYNVTEKGTFGQFIPAVAYSDFIGKSQGTEKTVLSLQQVSQSSKYRTNFGLLEASGEPVDVMFSVYDASNRKVAAFPLSLQGSQHLQFNSLLADRGVALEDGRVEVEVTSNTGRVTAYASVIDNRTNDPMLVSPVLRNAPAKSNRVILPSIGDFDIGVAHWKSDVRVFNAGSSATEVTLSYYPQGKAGTPSVIKTTLQPGEVRAFDDFIASNFGTKTTAGSLVITTPNPTNIVATAKTYTDTSNGTYGQFIPGVTPEQSIGSTSQSLQILQLEQSSRFRTNIGVAETSGKPAVAEISVNVPGGKSTTKLQIPLAANEFRQVSLIDFNLGTVYNARASVKVISGTGTVTAYGSLIDQVTQDPTYVPAQQ